VNVLTPVHFDGADIAERLQQMSGCELDMLDYGVVEMDHRCVVLRYNATESRHAGLPPDRVIGRHFFRDVAPCSNNRHVAQRYDAATLDDTIPYTFALRMKPVPVTLRMLKPADGSRMYLLVRWA
jgi:photoactive yellow protein